MKNELISLSLRRPSRQKREIQMAIRKNKETNAVLTRLNSELQQQLKVSPCSRRSSARRFHTPSAVCQKLNSAPFQISTAANFRRRSVSHRSELKERPDLAERTRVRKIRCMPVILPVNYPAARASPSHAAFSFYYSKNLELFKASSSPNRQF